MLAQKNLGDKQMPSISRVEMKPRNFGSRRTACFVVFSLFYALRIVLLPDYETTDPETFLFM